VRIDPAEFLRLMRWIDVLKKHGKGREWPKVVLHWLDEGEMPPPEVQAMIRTLATKKVGRRASVGMNSRTFNQNATMHHFWLLVDEGMSRADAARLVESRSLSLSRSQILDRARREGRRRYPRI
jgi:hypothetical protein